MRPAVLTVIMVNNDHPASNQDFIADLDVVCGGNVPPSRDRDVAPYKDSWREGLVSIAKNCFQPESRTCGKACLYFYGGDAPQRRSRTDLDSRDAKLALDHTIVKPTKRLPNEIYKRV
jgi:hypothetical protein